MILQDSQSKKTKIVFGPPGTGKTTYLLSVVEDALRKGIAPDKIGYFAFTKKAAKEAVTRAMEKFKLDRKSFKYFRTLHSMAFLMLGLQNSDVMNDDDYRAVSDYVQVKLINPNKSVDDLGVSTPQDPYLKIIDQAKIKNVSLSNEFIQNNEHIQGGFEKLSQIASGLQRYKYSRAKFDFTDMIVEFNKQNSAPKLEIVIIDEAQDLSFIQWQMTEILIRNSKEAYIAGDDDQAIFDWAGADTKRLGLIGGEREILAQSYRIPRAVHHVAANLINRVSDRVIKNWNPKEDEGIVQRHSLLFNNHIDFTKGEWLILARTNYMLDPIMDRLRDNGLFYQFKNRSSISEKMISAIQGWKSLQERQDIDLATAQNIYYYMKGNSNIEHGYKEKIKTADNEVMYNYESLSTHHGLRTDINTEWNFALDTIPDKMQRYINAALLRSSFNKSKNIKLSTIHASKGGEADNVVVLTDLPRKADLSISQKRDDERRVFYVATTRAKKSLHIIASKTNREFKELL